MRVEKSLENLREKMERELEDKKLELLEVMLRTSFSWDLAKLTPVEIMLCWQHSSLRT